MASLEYMEWNDFQDEFRQVKVNVLEPSPNLNIEDTSLLIRLITHRGDGIRQNADEVFKDLLEKEEFEVLLRLSTMMEGEYEKIELPTPSLGGKQGSDELMPQPYDDRVYRILLCISYLYPLILKPSTPPRFMIRNPSLIEHIRKMVKDEIARFEFDIKNSDNKDVSWRSFSHKEPRTLKKYQVDAIQEMIEREQQGNRGHYIYMKMGGGKTITALNFMRHLYHQDKLHPYVLWTAPKESLTELVKEMGKSLVKAHVAHKADELAPYSINVINDDRIRTMTDELNMLALQSLIVIDECDRCYGQSQRTSAALSMSRLAPQLILMSATPLRKPGQSDRLRDWLKLISDTPLNNNNWLVGLSVFVSKQFDLGITIDRQDIEIDFDDKIRDEYNHILEQKRDMWWFDLEKLVQKATDKYLVDEALIRDREYDGVLLVVENSEHMERIRKLIPRKIRVGDIEDHEGKDIVLVKKSENRGYNWSVEYGALITGVYPGNAAERSQMFGRIHRTGQIRDKIGHYIVYMKDTILELLHRRQETVEGFNLSLQTLAQKYEISRV